MHKGTDDHKCLHIYYISSVHTKQKLLRGEVCRHNKKHNRLECYASMLSEYFKVWSLTLLKIDWYSLIEQPVHGKV